MWELIASMIGSDMQKDGMGSGSMPKSSMPTNQPNYADNGSNADEGLAATPTEQPGMMDKMASGLLSPYAKGLDNIKSLYNNPDDKQALGGVLNMLSPSRQSMQIPATSNMPSMTTGNLGLPQMPNRLANQAYGRYY